MPRSGPWWRGWADAVLAYRNPQVAAMLFLFIWLRATLPRLRYDRLMKLGWKVLLPLATLNLLVTAIVLALGFAD